MVLWPTVLMWKSRKGASAVPEPWNATTGSVISNSATPPLVKVLGLVWLAITSIAVKVVSVMMVCGSMPVGVVLGK